MHGPIDYIVVSFPGNNFKGEILEELGQSIADGTIAVLDLSLITKDAEGNISAMEVSEFHEVLAPERTEIETGTGLINRDDLEEVGELLDNDSSAGLLIIEQLWARGLKQAIINADGVLVAEGRIHPDAAEDIDMEEEV